MSTLPFVELIIEALNLMHPRFARGLNLDYSAAPHTSVAGQRDRERLILAEFYHQFRRLWDKALPVRLKLGHLMIQDDPFAAAARPDWFVWQLGEQGEADRRFAALSLVSRSNPALDAELMLLADCRLELGYPHAVAVVVGTAEAVQSPPGVKVVVFDVASWHTVV